MTCMLVVRCPAATWSHGAMQIEASLHGYLLTIGPSCRPSSATCQGERVERGDFARRGRQGGGWGGGGMPGTGAGGCIYV